MIKAKLTSRRGMSLVELLVAIAILAILGSAIVFLLPASIETYQDVTTGSEASVLCSTLCESVASELRFAANVDGAASPAYDSQRFGAGVRMSVNSEGQLWIEKKDAGGFTRLRPLISDKAYTNGVYVDEFTYTYAGNTFTVSILVKSARSEQFARNDFQIQAVNGTSDGAL